MRNSYPFFFALSTLGPQSYNHYRMGYAHTAWATVAHGTLKPLQSWQYTIAASIGATPATSTQEGALVSGEFTACWQCGLFWGREGGERPFQGGVEQGQDQQPLSSPVPDLRVRPHSLTQRLSLLYRTAHRTAK